MANVKNNPVPCDLCGAHLGTQGAIIKKVQVICPGCGAEWKYTPPQTNPRNRVKAARRRHRSDEAMRSNPKDKPKMYRKKDAKGRMQHFMDGERVSKRRWMGAKKDARTRLREMRHNPHDDSGFLDTYKDFTIRKVVDLYDPMDGPSSHPLFKIKITRIIPFSETELADEPGFEDVDPATAEDEFGRDFIGKMHTVASPFDNEVMPGDTYRFNVGVNGTVSFDTVGMKLMARETDYTYKPKAKPTTAIATTAKSKPPEKKKGFFSWLCKDVLKQNPPRRAHGTFSQPRVTAWILQLTSHYADPPVVFVVDISPEGELEVTDNEFEARPFVSEEEARYASKMLAELLRNRGVSLDEISVSVLPSYVVVPWIEDDVKPNPFGRYKRAQRAQRVPRRRRRRRRY